MHFVYRVLYFLSVAIIILWLARPIIFQLIGLEFVNDDFRFDYIISWRYILPIAILTTLIGELGKGKSRIEIFKHLIIRIGIAILGIGLVFLSFFANFCTWIEQDIIYVSTSGSGRIVSGKVDCGALGSSSNSKLSIKRILPINSYIQWEKECDTTKIDHKKWIPLE